MNWPQILLIGFLAGAIIGGGYLVVADLIAIARAARRRVEDHIDGRGHQ